MSSRSNSSNQSKGTHLPLQKRVFNAPLAAVIAMGCVTGIAGGIAATSAHPMQAAYAASGTTQGVFTLDRAADGMDRSDKPEIPKEPYPVRYMRKCSEDTLFNNITDDMGDLDNIPAWSQYRTMLQNIYGLSDNATIAYSDSAAALSFEKDGKNHIIPLSNLCYIQYFPSAKVVTQPVPVQVSDSSSLSEEDKTKIIDAFIKANPKQKTGFTFDITADQITFEKYPVGDNNTVDILVWRGNPKTITDGKDYVQSINHVFFCGLRHLYYNNTDAHKKRDFPWGTNDDDEQLVPDKVEITEQVSELSAAHKKLIKDNIQKCIYPENLDCSSLDFTVDEASNKVTITLDGYKNAEEPLDSLIIRKIVPIELKAPAKKVPLADTSLYKPTNQELDKAKDQLVETNGDAVQKVEYDASKFTVKITEKNGSIVTKELPELFYLVPTPNPDSPLVKTDVKNVNQLLPTEIDTIKQAIAHTYKIQHQDCITIDTAKKCVTATWDSGNKGFSMSSPNNFDYYLELPFADVINMPPELKKLDLVAPSPVEVVDPTQIKPDEVTKIKEAIKAANQSFGLQDSEITVDTTSGKVTVKHQGYEEATLEADKVVTKKVVTPIEPPAPVPPVPAPAPAPAPEPAPEPPAKESPREILKRTNPAMFVAQSRIAGKTALDTMAKIVEQAFPSAENVVLATQYGYWDALSANALAGSLNAPIMLSGFDSLPEQTVAQLKRLQAKTVYICGGTHVISKQVEQQLHQLGMRVVRYAGSEASDTATKIALNTETVSDTCFITTSWGYGDSMSVSSYAYAKHAPIFLTNMNGDIDDSTLDAIRAKGFKHIVLVGGTSVISAEVEDLVRSLGASVERVWGETQYDTSLAFAKWATQDSKEPLTIGISTGYGFTDALCGAALTGKAGGVMVLADDSMTKQASSAFKDFVGTHAKQIDDLQIFGGTSVVGMGVTQALTSEFKEVYQNDNASAASNERQHQR